MEFEQHDIENPLDDNHLEIYEKIRLTLDKINPDLKNKNFILSGGFLIYFIFEKLVRKDEMSVFYGDIDLFFENENDFNEFKITLDSINKEDTPPYETSNAITYNIATLDATSASNPVKIQIIRSYFGKAKEIIKRFDLQNCQIALDNKGNLTLNSKFENFFFAKQIKINQKKILENLNRQGKNYLFDISKRIQKYMARYGLGNLHPDDYQFISDIEKEYYDVLTSDTFVKEMQIETEYSGDLETITATLNQVWLTHTNVFKEKFEAYKDLKQDWPVTTREFTNENYVL